MSSIFVQKQFKRYLNVNGCISFNMIVKCIVENVLVLLGGITLFLYGLKLMSEGMQSLVGNKMRRLLGATCKSPTVGVLLGTGVTAVTQSSTATNVMLIGFVNAGALTLAQAVGVIMGANIGSTVTAQLVSLSGSEVFNVTAIASLVALSGLIISFSGRRFFKSLGGVMLGLGFVFIGIEIMNSSAFQFKDYTFFRRLFMTKSPVFLILNGILITGIVQSSSAVSSVMIILAINGLISFEGSAFLILGTNIGAGIAVLLVSAPMSVEAKKVAVANLIFNVIGTLVWIVPLIAFKDGILRAFSLLGGGIERQIANFHTIFNLSTTLLLLPFVKQFVWLIERLFKSKRKTAIRKGEAVA